MNVVKMLEHAAARTWVGGCLHAFASSPLRLFALCLLLLALSACGQLGGGGDATATPITPIKLLATVFISPTPNASEREATRLAQPVMTSTPVPTRTPQATVYVGVFLGAADTGAVLDQARFAGTLTAPPP